MIFVSYIVFNCYIYIMEKILILSSVDYINSHYNTKEWEQSVKLIRWEHDYELEKYTIKYEDKES